jgi:hypothetical protein
LLSYLGFHRSPPPPPTHTHTHLGFIVRLHASLGLRLRLHILFLVVTQFLSCIINITRYGESFF